MGSLVSDLPNITDAAMAWFLIAKGGLLTDRRCA
jgi:hypothetical protein